MRHAEPAARAGTLCLPYAGLIIARPAKENRLIMGHLVLASSIHIDGWKWAGNFTTLAWV